MNPLPAIALTAAGLGLLAAAYIALTAVIGRELRTLDDLYPGIDDYLADLDDDYAIPTESSHA